MTVKLSFHVLYIKPTHRTFLRIKKTKTKKTFHVRRYVRNGVR